MGSLGQGRPSRALYGGLALFIFVVLLSAPMASGIRAGSSTGVATAAAAAAAVATQAAGVVTGPPAAAAPGTAPPDQAVSDPYRDSKRKVPNGPDPIHNRRATPWGDAPRRA